MREMFLNIFSECQTLFMLLSMSKKCAFVQKIHKNVVVCVIYADKTVFMFLRRTSRIFGVLRIVNTTNLLSVYDKKCQCY